MLRTRELVLLAAVLGVLVAGAVSVPVVDDDGGAAAPSPAPSGSAAPPSPGSTASPRPGDLVLSGLRATAFAAGSGEVAVRVVVEVTGERVTGAAFQGLTPLRVSSSGELTGTVTVACASRRTPLVLVLTTDRGRTLTAQVVLPSRAVDIACSAPAPSAPGPTASSKGS